MKLSEEISEFIVKHLNRFLNIYVLNSQNSDDVNAIATSLKEFVDRVRLLEKENKGLKVRLTKKKAQLDRLVNCKVCDEMAMRLEVEDIKKSGEVTYDYELSSSLSVYNEAK